MHENYSYFYWNNTYTNTWYAIPTDKSIEFFSGAKAKVEGVLSDTSIDKLIKRVNKK
jgi:hypothetical protein